MAEWKKVIVSGSSAELADLSLDTALTVPNGGTGLSAVSASAVLIGTSTTALTLLGTNGIGRVLREDGATEVNMSGSFSGSFRGSGAGLTGISADSTFSIESDGDAGGSFNTATDTLRFDTASAHGFSFSTTDATTFQVTLNTPQDLQTTADVTFNGITADGTIAANGAAITTDDTTFALVNTTATTVNFAGAATTLNIGASGSTNVAFFGGNIRTNNSVTASAMQLFGLAAGTDDTVLILDSTNGVQTREADSRIWGTTLVDGSGSASRVAFWSDANTVVSDANFTFASNVLTVNGSTFGQDVVVAGNFTVLGDTTVLDVTNILVEDKFILLNSGSANGDGGLIVQSGSDFNGVAYGWDESVARWGFQQATLLTQSSSAITPEAYAAAVVDIDGGLSDIAAFQKNGNIKIDSGEIYIYS